MTSVRDNWLHTIVTGKSGSNCDIDRCDVSLDTVQQMVSRKDAKELEYVKDPNAHELILSILGASFQGTLSRNEYAHFAALISEEEDHLITAITSLKNQYLSGLDHSINDAISDKEFLQVYSPLIPFLKRTEVLLSLGGDDRLSIDFAGFKQNKYLSSTIPRKYLINRGSCTCSSITMESYKLADQIRASFIQTVYETAMSTTTSSSTSTIDNTIIYKSIQTVFSIMQGHLFGRINRVLNLHKVGAEIVTFPSGSDAEFLPVVVALIRSVKLCMNNVDNIKVINYVSAAGEVGR